MGDIKTPIKAVLSEVMTSGRIVSHGKIEDLTNGFSLEPSYAPFTIYVRPKNASDEVDIVASLRGFQDDDFSDAPILLNDWSPLAILEIAPDAINLDNYDVFWGAGDYVENKD